LEIPKKRKAEGEGETAGVKRVKGKGKKQQQQEYTSPEEVGSDVDRQMDLDQQPGSTVSSQSSLEDPEVLLKAVDILSQAFAGNAGSV
jgi:hypothetical protein